MEKNFRRTLITSALPYANGPVHIGHLAGVYVPADIYARFLRQRGQEVLFVGGSDEHGVPITIKAKNEGVTPQDIVDRYHNIIKDSFEGLGISFDVYGRTTSETHRRVASDFFRRLDRKGQFILKTSKQLYDEQADQFLADRYVTGTCPHCGNDHAYGDQCEACGTSLNATDLINPKSAITGNTPVLRETTHWYLPLDKWEEPLRKWILEEHKEWKTNVYGQCKSWLDMGLQPRAVSRDLNWGIPVPAENAEGKVLYVWFDAPIGYISNTIDCVGDDWEKWWKQKDTRMIHFIGKDNIVFHCIVFPAMLMADGTYNLPDNVPANEFLNLENDKISTSRNWAVWLHEYLQELPGRQDELRYVLTANAPETKDNNFTWADFQARVNTELVAIFGNFVNRVAVLLGKYYYGEVPALGELTEQDKSMMTETKKTVEELTRNLENFKFRDASKEAMNIARIGNKYLADAEPWKAIKTDPERVKTVMNLCVQLCAQLAAAFEPFTPFASQKICKMFGMDSVDWSMPGNFDLIPAGRKVVNGGLLFEKIDDSVVEAQIKKLEDTKKANELKNWQPEPIKENVDFENFEKMDIRVGKVLECSKVKKSKKLLQFKIDDGMGGRTILSGIAQSYEDPGELVGKEICFIANFAPRSMMGIESQGMILSAVCPDGKLTVIGPTGPVVPGSQVG
ncbi:MAG: methionine--tRNA ligase [Clostridium sp.]|nr:methionine--tRNA ligase [Clostridium sp.]MCM1474937.1 methionine--tRNA ligase [Muribaculaceae bacterium]